MSRLIRPYLRLLAVLSAGVMVYVVLCGTPLLRADHGAHGHNAAHQHSALGCVVRDLDEAQPAPQLAQPVVMVLAPAPPVPMVQWAVLPAPPVGLIERFILPPPDTLVRQSVLLLI